MEQNHSLAGQSGLPRYFQLKELVLEKIRRREWVPGTALPSEREFVQQYGISRMTVRQALSELVNEGLIYREPGRGTFVKSLLSEHSQARLSGFNELMEAQGKHPGTQVLSAEMWPADEAVAKRLRIKPGQPVFRLYRLRLADGCPFSLERTHINFIGCEHLLQDDLEHHSLYQILEHQYGLPFLKAEQEISAGVLGKDESHYLNAPVGSPARLTHSIAFTDHDQPIEYTIATTCTSLKVVRLRGIDNPLSAGN